MPVKPTDQEDEYFARLEFERRRKVLDERETEAAEGERQRILAVAGGRCPKCGAELVPVPFRRIELDKCSLPEDVARLRRARSGDGRGHRLRRGRPEDLQLTSKPVGCRRERR
jgi:hypothetical protein